jgi:hypothetical protein
MLSKKKRVIMEQEKECATCFFEDTPVDEKPCLDCEIRDRWDNWKPKQPEVLTPDEWLCDQYPEKYSGEYIQTGGYHDACMHFAFESGEKQGIKKGRLERDFELSPLIEECREIIEILDSGTNISNSMRWNHIRVHLKNLEPVNENGK